VLSQLSYTPFSVLPFSSMGLSGLEPETSRLSGVRSNQLSYRPSVKKRVPLFSFFLRKEVIQPQVLLRLPCYDFTPITDHTFGTCLPHKRLAQ
jgi:hypothetical protein